MDTITIKSLLEEISVYTKVAPGVLSQAAKSNVNYENNQEFAEEVDNWKSGVYDEDPELLYQALERIIEII